MKMKPYKEGSRHDDVSNAYNACSTCYYVKDKTGSLTCTHPDRGKLKVYCMANNGSEEHSRDMSDSTNFQVDAKEWCASYKAADAPDAPEYENMYEAMESAYEQHSPTPHAEYGTGGTASGTGAGGAS
jgi:hypothetical protein